MARKTVTKCHQIVHMHYHVHVGVLFLVIGQMNKLKIDV